LVGAPVLYAEETRCQANKKSQAEICLFEQFLLFVAEQIKVELRGWWYILVCKSFTAEKRL